MLLKLRLEFEVVHNVLLPSTHRGTNLFLMINGKTLRPTIIGMAGALLPANTFFHLNIQVAKEAVVFIVGCNG